MHHVVGIQHCRFTGFTHAFRAEGQHIGQRPHANKEVAVKRAHLQMPLACTIAQCGFWQELLKQGFAADRACARAAAAVRSGEGFMQIKMHNIKAHISGARNAHNGV